MNDQPIHKSETQANSTETEKIPSPPNDPVAPIKSKNRSNILERIEMEEPNTTKVKAKKSKKSFIELRLNIIQNEQHCAHTEELQRN